MADTTISTKSTNGVSFGYKHTVTSTDATNTAIVFDFQVDYALAATVQVFAETTGAVATSDAKITFPADGQVRIANGSSFTLTAGQVIAVVAQRDRQELT